MKKIYILLVILFTTLIASCSNEDSVFNNIGENIKNVKTTDTQKVRDVTVSCNIMSAYITPNNFDYDDLSEFGYLTMTISVSYSVTYEKTWTGWDFLYTGSPKYDVCIKNSDSLGVEQTALSTSGSSISRTITYTSSIVDIINNRIILEFSSTNIQNDINFKNIIVNYKCYK